MSMSYLLLATAALLLQGCALFAYTNTKLGTPEIRAPQASFAIAPRPVKREPRVLVLLALSGGGSRAAYFSARTMQALERLPGPQGQINALNEVDLISSVSGGSLAAAYYASSFDPGTSSDRRIWDDRTVTDLLSRNYIARWVGNWFWPVNIAKFWFTAFDRTDIMAQTFADNLFDSATTGIDLRFRDLNPSRPNLVLNATVGSRSYDENDPEGAKLFGTVFTFTHEDFVAKLASDIGDYELARGVMASATFPAAFNYMTLRDMHEPPTCPGTGPDCFVHVFDGGNADNLGLMSLKRVLLANHAAAITRHDRIVVILVDAYRRSRGVDPRSANPRGLLSYVIDLNFLDATDSLLEANRQRLLDEFFSRGIVEYAKVDLCRRDNLPDDACVASPAWRGPSTARLQQILAEKLFFFHVTFDAVTDTTLRERLHAIPTTFSFDPGEMDAIEKGVADIFTNPAGTAQPCVRRLGEILTQPSGTRVVVEGNPWCGGAGRAEKEERARFQRFQK